MEEMGGCLMEVGTLLLALCLLSCESEVERNREKHLHIKDKYYCSQSSILRTFNTIRIKRCSLFTFSALEINIGFIITHLNGCAIIVMDLFDYRASTPSNKYTNAHKL